MLILCYTTFAQQYGSFKDSRDGRVYKTVKIGEQEWMAENLNVDRFQNGDLIPEARTVEEWKEALKNKQPAWCYYDNDTKNGEIIGKLYNLFAITDTRGILPIGWHLPSENEYKILFESSKINISPKVQIKLEVNYPKILKKIIDEDADSIFLKATETAERRSYNTDESFLMCLFKELIEKTNSKRNTIYYFKNAFNIKSPDDLWIPYFNDISIDIDIYKKVVADTLASTFREIINEAITLLNKQNISTEISYINTTNGIISLLIDCKYPEQWRVLFKNNLKLLRLIQECNLALKDIIELKERQTGLSLIGSRGPKGEFLEWPSWAAYKKEVEISWGLSGEDKREVLTVGSFMWDVCGGSEAYVYSSSEKALYVRCLKN